MTAVLKVLVPEATSNYVLNPSFRYSATTDTNTSVGGWFAIGGLIERVLTQALYGIASLKVKTSGVVPREGVYYRVNGLSGINDPITASVYVRGAGIVHLRLIEGSKEWVSEAQALHSDRWVRFEVSGFTIGSDDVRMYIETDNVQPSVTFYVDGAQIERKAYATTYCDGDQPGCRWNIINSASISTRPWNYREGGRWVELAGPCRENDDIYVTMLGGFGMPSLQHNIQSWALTPGSYFQNTKIMDRVVTIQFNIKKEHKKMVKIPDASPLHRLRQQLIDIIKPDLTIGNEAFLFSYQDGNRELFVRMRYEAGLDGSWDIRNQWGDSMPVRFLVVDPVLFENNLNSQELLFKDDAYINDVAGRIDGKWSHLNYGVGEPDHSDTVWALTIGKKGEVYIGGRFNKANFNANAIDPNIPVNGIAWWNGSQWDDLGTGIGSNSIYCMAVHPNGNLYVGGSFTTISGVAANYVAYWDGTSWHALGTGLDSSVLAMAFAPNGDLYVGGTFDAAGGNPAYHVSKWDGLTWSSLGGSAGLEAWVYAVAISFDGTEVFFGGEFHDEYGSAGTDLYHVCKYTVATNVFSALGSGLDEEVFALEISPSGVLYAGGSFHHSGTTDINCIAKWSGSMWIALGSGITATVWNGIATGITAISIIDDNHIYVGGHFEYIGNIYAQKFGIWNGSTWVNTDIELNGDTSNSRARTMESYRGDIYFGGNALGGSNTGRTKSYFSVINTVNNSGTAETFPVIYIYGPGELRWIENQTTKKTVYLDLSIIDNEEVFIDFGNKKIYSTIRGDLFFSVLPGSDFGEFSLIPGDNKISVFMTQDVDSKMVIYYQPRHWSMDASEKAEAL